MQPPETVVRARSDYSVAGHRQVFRSRRANDVVGFLSGNLGIGLSFYAKRGVPYLGSTLLGCYVQALGDLRTAGRA